MFFDNVYKHSKRMKQDFVEDSKQTSEKINIKYINDEVVRKKSF